MAKKSIFISGQEMLTALGIAEYFGVSLSTIQNWERQGKITLQRDMSDSARGTRFILPQDFEELKKTEQVRKNKYVNKTSEKNRLITFLSALNINTVEDFVATYMSQPVVTGLAQPNPHPAGYPLGDVMVTPNPVVAEPEQTIASDDNVLWSSGGLTDERLPIDAETRDEMFGSWIADNVNQPEVTSRADINIDNGKEAVKGCGFLLWTKEK